MDTSVRMEEGESLESVECKKAKNKRFAKESRDRKKRYVKELEHKVEYLEEKVQKLTLELAQFKSLLNVGDLTDSKQGKLTSVCQDFMDMKVYVRDQLYKNTKGPFDGNEWMNSSKST